MTHTISFQTGALANAMADAVNAGQALTLSVEQMRGLLADVNAVIVERDGLRAQINAVTSAIESERRELDSYGELTDEERGQLNMCEHIEVLMEVTRGNR